MSKPIRMFKLVSGELVLGKYDEDTNLLEDVAIIQIVPTHQVSGSLHESDSVHGRTGRQPRRKRDRPHQVVSSFSCSRPHPPLPGVWGRAFSNLTVSS